jgi:hypothetical protein
MDYAVEFSESEVRDASKKKLKGSVKREHAAVFMTVIMVGFGWIWLDLAGLALCGAWS